MSGEIIRPRFEDGAAVCAGDTESLLTSEILSALSADNVSDLLVFPGVMAGECAAPTRTLFVGCTGVGKVDDTSVAWSMNANDYIINKQKKIILFEAQAQQQKNASRV